MYCFGDPAKMSDPSSRLALRIHDEARNGLPINSCVGKTANSAFSSVTEATSSAQISAPAGRTSYSVLRRPLRRRRTAGVEW